MSNTKSFSSKILLFGEYSVIKNSMALSIPYPLFEGKLTFRRDNSVAIDPELKAFSIYIKKLIEEDLLQTTFDISSFEFDVSQGLFFDSTIPQGYGAGSSGALVASVFDRYGNVEKEQIEIKKLKSLFSMLESHFHGSSSGVDPLISFLNSPILIKNKNELGPVELPIFKKGKGGVFLINTKRSRKTEPLVNLFLEKCTNVKFEKFCENELTIVTNNCINHFLSADINSLFVDFKVLSQYQYDHLGPMIPKLYREEWLQGIKFNHFYFKLCGAGGGGFLMGITHDFETVKKLLSNHELRLILSF
jgi:mevalonate kinase